MTGARVSVVMITFNRAREARRAVQRLRALDESLPVLVVDNGSSDGTSTALAREFPGITVIPLARNAGAAGRNVGVAAARTPYVAFCDDDTSWEPGSLERACGHLDRNPRLAVANARTVIDPDGRDDPASLAMAQSPLPPHAASDGVPILGFMAGASVVRRDAFLGVGGFDPRFHIGGEEELVAIDLARAGWDLSYCADTVVHHEPSRARNATARERRRLRNAVWTAWLRRPMATVAARNLSLRQLPLRERWLVYREVVGGLPSMARDRHVVPADLEARLRLIEAA